MPAPLAKGIIIAASVLVAAGIAIYESPQVRQWLDQSRRKIAIALHQLGDEIQPRRQSECSEDFEARRADIIRQRRNELIRRAREEGIAVDLDELIRIGRGDVEMSEQRGRSKTNASQRSFDDIVGSDGMLRASDTAATKATGTDAVEKSLRRRGMVGFTAGAGAGSATNPFSDDASLPVDNDDAEAPSPKPFVYVESRESSATLDGDTKLSPPAGELIDLTPASPVFHPENPQTASIPQSEAGDDGQTSQSFHSFITSSSVHNTSQFADVIHDGESDIEDVSAATMTPRSERSAFTGASVVGSHADDVAVLSLQNDEDHEARSEQFSEAGFTDAGYSDVGFSETGSQQGVGAMTPSSWTDVGSDDESEWGGPGNGGQVHQ